jgi:hypothetical protein
MIEEGSFNKNIYSKKKMHIVRRKVHGIYVMARVE